MFLFEKKILFGLLSVNKDPKHLVKRLRGILISEVKTIKIIEKSINKQHLIQAIPNIKSSLLNPKDYQNVPAAVELLESLSKLDCDEFDRNKVSIDVGREIKLLSIIIEHFLILFTDVRVSLIDQLSSLAALSFILFYVQRRNKTSFITNSLYTDIQMTIQDAFWVTYQFQTHGFEVEDEDLKVFLNQLGTDQLEALFSVIRTQSHSSNFTFFELLQRINICLQIEKVYKENPNWKAGSRLCVGKTLDHSSSRSWIGDLSPNEVNLELIWTRGHKKAKDILNKFGFSHSEMNIDIERNPRTSVLNYSGCYSTSVIYDEDETDFNFDQSLITNENLETNFNNNLDEFDDINSFHNNTVTHMSVAYNKSNVINSLINCKT